MERPLSMSQPSNNPKQPDNNPEQPDNQKNGSLTQEFNFPKAWIRDYNPQIHGVQSPEKIRRAESSADPQKYLTPQAPNQPQQAPITSLPPQQNLSQAPAQWNPNGVYGGLPEAEKKGIPWWVWVVLVAVVVIAILVLIVLVR